MNRSTAEATPEVPPEEVERRIWEFRQRSFQGRLPAQVVYHDPYVTCPWPECGLRILGMNFRLDRLGDAEQISRWLENWWVGPGLVGRCPKCNRHVAFEVTRKRAVADLEGVGDGLLPDDWHQKAHVVVRPA